VARDGRSWSLDLHTCTYQHPTSSDLAAAENRHSTAERQRLVYVAATRARDLLVVPRAGAISARHMVHKLLGEQQHAAMKVLDTYHEGRGARWSMGLKAPGIDRPLGKTDLDQKLAARWRIAAEASSIARLVPMAVSVAAERVVEAPLADEETACKEHQGRHGTAFGSVVHQALGAVISGRARSVPTAVEEAARANALDPFLVAEASADVDRGLKALRAAGLLVAKGARAQVEYPVAEPRKKRTWPPSFCLSGGVERAWPLPTTRWATSKSRPTCSRPR
jgi:ATP-dependent helicase/nuclease subunit A